MWYVIKRLHMVIALANANSPSSSEGSHVPAPVGGQRTLLSFSSPILTSSTAMPMPGSSSPISTSR